MSEVTRPGVETLKLLNCPCCGGDIDVFECGYSSFNPGSARCQGECRRVWELGYVDSEWDCGERWNKKSATISKRLRALGLLKAGLRMTEDTEIASREAQEEAILLLDDLEVAIIGTKSPAAHEKGE